MKPTPSTEPVEVTRRAVMSRLRITDLRKFRRTTIYALLKIDEVTITRKDVRYPQESVVSAFRARGLKWV